MTQNSFDEEFKGLRSLMLKKLLDRKDDDHFGYLHPLGFITIPVKQINERLTLKLHFWPNDRTITNSKLTIHCHKNELTSHVMCGEITNTIYNVQDIKPFTHVVYECGIIAKGTRIISKTQTKVNCRILQSTTHFEDDIYRISSDRFHTSHVKKDTFTATLVLVAGTKNALVLGKQNGRKLYTTSKNVCKQKSVKDLLITLKEQLI